MIEVFDNFLPNEYFEELQSKILGFSQPWYYLNNITFPDKKGDCLGEYGFNYWIVSKGGLLGDDPTSKMVYNLLMKMRKVSPYKISIDLDWILLYILVNQNVVTFM